MSESSFIGNFSLLCIATAAIMVQQVGSSTSRRDDEDLLHSNRILWTVLLWLTASLVQSALLTPPAADPADPPAPSYDAAAALVHVVFLGNIVSTCYHVNSIRQQRQRVVAPPIDGVTGITTSTTTTNTQHYFWRPFFVASLIIGSDLLPALAHAAWLSMILQSFFLLPVVRYFPLTNHTNSWWVLLLCTWALLSSYRFYQRRRRHHQRWMRLPMTVGTTSTPPVFSSWGYNNSLLLSEKDWHRWTPVQVLYWMRTQLQEQQRQEEILATVDSPYNNALLDDDDDDADAVQDLVSSLAPERIRGSQLAGLTLLELRSMRIPYGPAAQLIRSIQRLIERFPHQDSPATGWLAELDQQNNNKNSNQNNSQPWSTGDHNGSLYHRNNDYERRTSPQGPAVSMVAVDEGLLDKARNRMRDRSLDLELPPMVPSSSSLGSVQHQTRNGGTPRSLASTTTPGDNGPLWGILSPEVMAEMPPHILEIIQQKPELAQQVLASTRHHLSQQPYEPDASNDPLWKPVGSKVVVATKKIQGLPSISDDEPYPQIQVALGSGNTDQKSSSNSNEKNNYRDVHRDEEEWCSVDDNNDNDSEAEMTELLYHRRSRGYKSIIS